MSQVRHTSLLLVAATVLLAADAGAQDARQARRIEEMNRAAMEDYDLLEFEGAKKQLSEALAVVKKAKLERSKVAARTHMNLGIVYGGGLGDQDTALLEFVSALEIDPDLKLDPAYRSPALQKTLDQARSTTGGQPTTPPVPVPVESALKHNPIEEAPSGEPILISVRATGEILDRTSQMVLRYRPAGAEGFVTAPMKSGGGAEFQGLIPDTATRGDTVHYFIEAKAATGKVLASAGSVDSPHIVSIVKPAGRSPDDDPPDEENPIGRSDPPPGSGSGDDTGVVKSHPSVHRSFYVNVTVGSGAGYITKGGETEVSHQAVTCCLAPAPLHVMPEIGFWLSRQLTLSIVGRVGFPLGANVAGAATLAPAGLLRISYIFGKDGGVYVHGDVGGGWIRHTIKLTRMSATANQGDTDTFVTGPLLVGAGAGWILPLGGSGLRFVLDLNLTAGIPIVSSIGSGTRASKPGFAMNGDLSLGVGFAF